MSIFFSCPIALAKISSTTLNRNYKFGCPCLVPELRRNYSVFIIMCDVSCGFFVDVFYQVYQIEKVAFCSSILLNFFPFIMKKCWILSTIIETVISFCRFFLLTWYITLIDFLTLNQPYIPTWSWCIILFIYS